MTLAGQNPPRTLLKAFQGSNNTTDDLDLEHIADNIQANGGVWVSSVPMYKLRLLLRVLAQKLRYIFGVRLNDEVYINVL